MRSDLMKELELELVRLGGDVKNLNHPEVIEESQTTSLKEELDGETKTLTDFVKEAFSEENIANKTIPEIKPAPKTPASAPKEKPAQNVQDDPKKQDSQSQKQEKKKLFSKKVKEQSSQNSQKVEVKKSEEKAVVQNPAPVVEKPGPKDLLKESKPLPKVTPTFVPLTVDEIFKDHTPKPQDKRLEDAWKLVNTPLDDLKHSHPPKIEPAKGSKAVPTENDLTDTAAIETVITTPTPPVQAPVDAPKNAQPAAIPTQPVVQNKPVQPVPVVPVQQTVQPQSAPQPVNIQQTVQPQSAPQPVNIQQTVQPQSAPQPVNIQQTVQQPPAQQVAQPQPASVQTVSASKPSKKPKSKAVKKLTKKKFTLLSLVSIVLVIVLFFVFFVTPNLLKAHNNDAGVSPKTTVVESPNATSSPKASSSGKSPDSEVAILTDSSIERAVTLIYGDRIGFVIMLNNNYSIKEISFKTNYNLQDVKYQVRTTSFTTPLSGNPIAEGVLGSENDIVLPVERRTKDIVIMFEGEKDVVHGIKVSDIHVK